MEENLYDLVMSGGFKPQYLSQLYIYQMNQLERMTCPSGNVYDLMASDDIDIECIDALWQFQKVMLKRIKVITSSTTAFSVSATTGYACIAPDLSPYTETLYHNGEAEYPELGDVVTEDAAGTIPAALIGDASDHLQQGDLAYLQTDAAGVSTAIVCK